MKSKIHDCQKRNSKNKNVKIINNDIHSLKLKNSALITSFYTIQLYIPQEGKQFLIKFIKL